MKGDGIVTERSLYGAFQFSWNGGVSFCDMYKLYILFI